MTSDLIVRVGHRTYRAGVQSGNVGVVWHMELTSQHSGTVAHYPAAWNQNWFSRTGAIRLEYLANIMGKRIAAIGPGKNWQFSSKGNE